MEVFEPDVLIVDYLPLGVANELARVLRRARKRGNTRCVLGLRDVLYDRETVPATWANRANLDAIRHYYDAVWIYGDPAVFEPLASTVSPMPWRARRAIPAISISNRVSSWPAASLPCFRPTYSRAS